MVGRVWVRLQRRAQGRNPVLGRVARAALRRGKEKRKSQPKRSSYIRRLGDKRKESSRAHKEKSHCYPTFMALCTANGAVLRVDVFSLGTLAVSLLPVPGVQDQSNDP